MQSQCVFPVFLQQFPDMCQRWSSTVITANSPLSHSPDIFQGRNKQPQHCCCSGAPGGGCAAPSLEQQSSCHCEVDLTHCWVLPAPVLVLHGSRARARRSWQRRLQGWAAVPRHCPSLRALRLPCFLGKFAESYPIATGVFSSQVCRSARQSGAWRAQERGSVGECMQGQK